MLICSSVWLLLCAQLIQYKSYCNDTCRLREIQRDSFDDVIRRGIDYGVAMHRGIPFEARAVAIIHANTFFFFIFLEPLLCNNKLGLKPRIVQLCFPR